MDHRHFETLTRSLAAVMATSSRRAVARKLATFSLAAALGSRIRLEEAEAKKRKNKKNKKNKNQNTSTDQPTSRPKEPCQPNCNGRSCGADGCGGSCGSCGTGLVCQDGQCTSNGCPDGKKDCRGTCIPVADCCVDGDCGAGSCQSGTCHWEPVRAETEREEVASERYMQTKATLNTNGLLTVESTTWNEVFAGFALRGRVLVVVEDAQGRAIWVSKVFECTTRCPFLEVCDKSGKDVFQEHFPDHPQLGPVVGKYAAKLAIYQSNGASAVTFRDRWVEAIKDATDIAGPLVELVKLFL